MTPAGRRCFFAMLVAAALTTACTAERLRDEWELPRPDLTGADPEVRALAARLEAEVRLHPEAAESWGRLGDLYRTCAFPVEAIEAYERARSLEPGAFPWIYRLGLTWSYLDPRRAAPLLREAVRLRPAYTPARVHLARTLIALGADDDARRELLEALAENPGLVRARVLLASLRLREGSLEEARGLLETALREVPEDPEALRLLAQVLRRLGEPEATAVEQRALVARGPPAPLPDPEARSLAPPAGARAQFERGVAAMEAGRFEQAERAFRRALDNQPGHAPSHLQLGRLLAHQGRSHEAQVHLREAAKLRPDDPIARLALGRVLDQAGLHGEAAQVFEEARALQPDSWDAQVGLGTSLVQSGRDRGRGMDLLQDAWRQRQDPALGAFLGSELAREGRFEEAQKVLETAWSDGAGPPEAGVNLALLEARRGAIRQAQRRLERVLELHPDRSEGWLGLGHVHRRAGRFQEAADAYRKALAAEPSAPEAGAWLAWTLLQDPEQEAKPADEVLAAAHEASRRSPADPWCRLVYAVALQAAGRHAEATEHARKASALARAAGRQDLVEKVERWFGPPPAAPAERPSRATR